MIQDKHINGLNNEINRRLEFIQKELKKIQMALRMFISMKALLDNSKYR